jgi:hypothetical protein
MLKRESGVVGFDKSSKVSSGNKKEDTNNSKNYWDVQKYRYSV